MIKIRRHDGDKPLIEYLDSRLFVEEERVEHINESAWWVGWNGDIPVAYAGAKLIPQANCVFLSRAGVMPEARGQGLQRKMIAIRLRWARQQGVKRVITYTHPLNVVSSNNLIRSGFLLYRPEWEWAGPEFLYWIHENKNR